MKTRRLASTLGLIAALLAPAAASALGTYSTGRILVQKLTKFEGRGLIWESFEGEAEVASFDSKEKCDTKENQCYAPTKGLVKFSIRPETAKVVNFLRTRKGQGGFILHYRIHKIEAAALEEDMEILDVTERVGGKPPGMEDTMALKDKPGSRSFSVPGRILDLGYEGTMFGTYQGLYQDTKTGKVHPFSVNDDKLADFALRAMTTSAPYYLGISQAKISGYYSSDHFLFEINFREEAGGVAKEQPKMAPKETPKEEPKDAPKKEEPAAP